MLSFLRKLFSGQSKSSGQVQDPLIVQEESFSADRFEQALNRYKSLIEKQKPGFAEIFCAGANPATLDELEAVLGFQLSAGLRELLLSHDGNVTGCAVLPGWELFSAERIGMEWKIWEDLYHAQFKPEGYQAEARGPVRDDEWWRLRWVPFCGNGCGDHLVIDMDPAPGGTIGQVVTMWHDTSERLVVAPSLAEYFEMIAKDVEAGRLAWDDDHNGVFDVRDRA